MAPAFARLFEAWQRGGVRAAAFKSLEKLANGLVGKDDDLDIVVPKRQADQAVRLLKTCGFVEDRASGSRLGADIRVFRGVESQSGRMIMVHLHLRLRFGPKPGKPLVHPEQDAVCKRASKRIGAPCVGKADEIAIRAAWAITKGQAPDDHLVSGARKLAPDDGWREAARPLFGAHADEVLVALAAADEAFLRSMRDVVANRCRDAPVRAQWQGTVARWRPRLASGRAKFVRSGHRAKLGTGRILALVGVDGSGKTTTAEAIARLLRPWAPTATIYLGRAHWQWRVNKGSSSARATRRQSLAYLITSNLELLSRYRRARRLRRRGYWVVLDRHFLDKHMRDNDQAQATSGNGPRPHPLRARVQAWLAARPIDAMVFLDLPPEVAAARDKDHSADHLALTRQRYIRNKDLLRLPLTGSENEQQVAARVIDLVFQHVAHE